MNSRRFPLLVALLAATSAGCDKSPAGPNPPPAAGAPPSKPAAPAAAGIRFEECAESSGLRFRMRFLPDEQGEQFKINFYDHGCAVVVGDIDADDRDDVFFCNQLGPCGLFKNLGGGKFADVTKDAGDLAKALDGKICVGAAFADADRDGNVDLFVTTTRGGNVFLKSLGGGKFRDATKEAGLTLVEESETPCFFDADGDGDLDLLLTNTAHWTLDQYDDPQRYYRGKSTLDELIASEGESNVFYVNDGAGRFKDVTEESGMRSKGWGGDVAVFDFDGDGDPDVFVGNMFGGSALYRNDGRKGESVRFTDVTTAVLGRTSWGAVGARAFDYDGDGKLDLFVVDMHSDMWSQPNISPSKVEEKRRYGSFMERSVELGTATKADDVDFTRRAAIPVDRVVFGNTLYHALGGGKFEEVSAQANAETFWPWGIAEGDFDSDGFVDAFIPTGMGYPFFYWRASMLHNRGDGSFEDVCRSAGTEPPPGGSTLEVPIAGRGCPKSSRSAATADFDGDGRVDLVVNNFNDRAFLYRNVSPQKHWIELRLAGTKSNPDAVGALVTVTAGGRTQIRQVQAVGGYLSQSSNTLHFGLGDAGEVERVEIRWPSGAVKTLKRIKIDALTKVKESSD